MIVILSWLIPVLLFLGSVTLGCIAWDDIEGFEWLSSWVVRVRLRRRPGFLSMVEDPLGFWMKRRDFITNKRDREAVHAFLRERLPALGEG